METPSKQNFTIRLDPLLREELNKLARERRWSVGEAGRYLMEQGLKHEKQLQPA